MHLNLTNPDLEPIQSSWQAALFSQRSQQIVVLLLNNHFLDAVADPLGVGLDTFGGIHRRDLGAMANFFDSDTDAIADRLRRMRNDVARLHCSFVYPVGRYPGQLPFPHREPAVPESHRVSALSSSPFSRSVSTTLGYDTGSQETCVMDLQQPLPIELLTTKPIFRCTCLSKNPRCTQPNGNTPMSEQRDSSSPFRLDKIRYFS